MCDVLTTLPPHDIPISTNDLAYQAVLLFSVQHVRMGLETGHVWIGLDGPLCNPGALCTCWFWSALLTLLNLYFQQKTTALYTASHYGRKEVVELLLDSGASMDKPNMVTYRLAFTQTLRERVCVPHCISMWHHGTPQDNTGYRSIELHYSTQSVHSHNKLPWRHYTCTSSVLQSLFFCQCLATRLSIALTSNYMNGRYVPTGTYWILA